MTKKEIAQTVVDVCRHDAAFCKDIRVDPEPFLSEISGAMDEKSFLFSVEKYLAAFGVRGHLNFYKSHTDGCYIGFRVRRYLGSLFVTDSEVDDLLKGDEIVAIDGASVPQTAETYHAFLDEAPDRCSDVWEDILSRSETIAVKRDERTINLAVRAKTPRSGSLPYEHKKIHGDCLYLRFDDFYDETDMKDFLDGCREEIEHTKYLVIDVRENVGGSDTVFLPLLKYCLEEDDALCNQPIFPAAVELLCTERNSESRLSLFESYRDKAYSEEMRRFYEELIEEQIKNKGKGFVPMKADGFLFSEHGTRLPEKVVVLTDYTCGSSGESFVETAARLKKVTVIGRPTMGICDYSNLAYVDFGDYYLLYPTSRSKAIDEGKATRGRGIQPDIFVPWTPEHLREDVDIAAALKFLNLR